jgi:hypothetical protein
MKNAPYGGGKRNVLKRNDYSDKIYNRGVAEHLGYHFSLHN